MSTSVAPKQELVKALSSLPPHKTAAVKGRISWIQKARPKQIPPDTDWFAFLALSGRGWGKSRVCSEDSWWYCAWNDGVRLAVVAPTNSDLKRTVFEGDSGLISVAPPDVLDGGTIDSAYNSSNKELRFANGSIIQGFSSESYQRLRGPQFHRAWCEELAAWPYMQETWDMLMFGLRLGDKPRAVISTTPRPYPLIKELSKREDVYTVYGSTYENEANLAPSFLEVIKTRYEGSRVGLQEIQGTILENIEGALWTWETIEKARYNGPLPDMKRIVVAIDPAVTSGEDSDETGIIVAGLGKDDRGYILADNTCRESPLGWAQKAVDAYDFWKADKIIGEANNGGDLIEANIKTVRRYIPYRKVHASRGKIVRAQPIASLYEQQRVSHCGVFKELEAQLTGYVPDSGMPSPNNMDAMVWSLTDLMVDAKQVRVSVI
jgi:phage terminase large subunit-like protein